MKKICLLKLREEDGYLHKVEDTFLARPSEEQHLSERVACVSLSLFPLGHLSVRASKI